MPSTNSTTILSETKADKQVENKAPTEIDQLQDECILRGLLCGGRCCVIA